MDVVSSPSRLHSHPHPHSHSHGSQLRPPQSPKASARPVTPSRSLSRAGVANENKPVNKSFETAIPVSPVFKDREGGWNSRVDMAPNIIASNARGKDRETIFNSPPKPRPKTPTRFIAPLEDQPGGGEDPHSRRCWLERMEALEAKLLTLERLNAELKAMLEAERSDAQVLVVERDALRTETDTLHRRIEDEGEMRRSAEERMLELAEAKTSMDEDFIELHNKNIAVESQLKDIIAERERLLSSTQKLEAQHASDTNTIHDLQARLDVLERAKDENERGAAEYRATRDKMDEMQREVLELNRKLADSDSTREASDEAREKESMLRHKIEIDLGESRLLLEQERERNSRLRDEIMEGVEGLVGKDRRELEAKNRDLDKQLVEARSVIERAEKETAHERATAEAHLRTAEEVRAKHVQELEAIKAQVEKQREKKKALKQQRGAPFLVPPSQARPGVVSREASPPSKMPSFISGFVAVLCLAIVVACVLNAMGMANFEQYLLGDRSRPL